jgi:HicB_like antitoxin of bacterial toxin-antitoxin system
MSQYFGILDASGKACGVRIPDCPGAYGAGRDPGEAVTSAIRGLSAWAAATVKDGDALPVPRSLDQILASGELEKGEAIVLIPLMLNSGRTVKANVTFDAGLLEAIDEAAVRSGVTRSAFLASAAREKIETAA